MKKVLLSGVYLFAFLSLMLSSCDKEDSKDDEQPNNPVASMTAKIDDVAWTANQSGCTVTDDKAGIGGSASQEPTIIISLSGFSEDTFLLEFNGNSVGAVTDGNITHTTNSDPQAGGSVTITSINTTDSVMSGIFEFVAYSFFKKGFISITEGIFTDIPFTTELPGTPENSLEVDIDGSAFDVATVNASVLMSKIMITASNAGVTETVGLTLTEGIAVGTYDIGGFTGDVLAQYNIGSTVIMMANSGQLVVTNHDESLNLIEGTFEFEAAEMMGTNSASFTNGSFEVNY